MGARGILTNGSGTAAVGGASSASASGHGQVALHEYGLGGSISLQHQGNEKSIGGNSASLDMRIEMIPEGVDI